jgi:penicillin-binding protein 1A
MLSLGYIEESQYNQASEHLDTAQLNKLTPEVEMPYIAEMVRSRMYECYGEKAYTGGYQVTATVDSSLQNSAQTALRNALWEYSERYGYYGPVAHEKLPSSLPNDTLPETVNKILEAYPERGGLLPSLVLAVEQRKVKAYNKQGMIEIGWGDLSWARRISLYKKRFKIGSYPRSAWNILRRGDVIMVRAMGTREVPQKKTGLTKVSQQETPTVEEVTRWRLADIPRVEGALVALNPTDGSILALAGGFDFYHSKFNRGIQAERQPGSSFKPFVYSAALKRGFSPNTYIADTPLVIRAGGKTWKPRNYSYKFYGSIPLRHALIHSYNVASVRLLMRVGLNAAIDHVTLFGFKREKIPRNLTFVLGTGAITPLESARGYAVFANGGHLVEPFIIRRIENMEGQVVYSAKPLQVCQSCTPLNETSAPRQSSDQCLGSNNSEQSGFLSVNDVSYGTHAFSGQQISLAPRVISYNNAFAMTSILKDVIQRGTAQKARVLKRKDIAGKTGTTQEAKDAWFVGYTPDIVTVTWVGFDQPRSLGSGETGGRAALPMWIDFMQDALRGKPEKTLDSSGGVRTQLIANRDTKIDVYGTKPSSAPATVTRQTRSTRQRSTSTRRQPAVTKRPTRHSSTTKRSSPRRQQSSASSRSTSRSTSSGSKRQTTSSSPPSRRVVPVQLF